MTCSGSIVFVFMANKGHISGLYWKYRPPELSEQFNQTAKQQTQPTNRYTFMYDCGYVSKWVFIEDTNTILCGEWLVSRIIQLSFCYVEHWQTFRVLMLKRAKPFYRSMNMVDYLYLYCIFFLYFIYDFDCVIGNLGKSSKTVFILCLVLYHTVSNHWTLFSNSLYLQYSLRGHVN